MASDLDRAVDTVLGRCLALRADEELLVIADPERERLGQAMLAAGRALGADGSLMVLPPDPRRGFEPPRAVAAAFSACDVFLAPCEPSLSHTVARKNASEKGIRGATLPGVTEEMLTRVMTADLAAVKRRSDAVARLLTESGEAHVSCPRGTDFTLDLGRRGGYSDDGDLRSPRAFGNLPCGEGYVAPLNGHGRLVVSSVAGIGLGHGDLTVEDGRLTQATGDEGEQLLATLRQAGELGTNLAELGVGTNEKATLTGNVLEDEKMLGTVHVAFGASMAIGGTVSVPVHLDSVIVEPTLRIGATRVIEGGRFLL
jgi:leucyl aminopeptidase (aminopeptidase T)